MHHDYDVGAHHYAGHNDEPGDYHYGGEHDIKHYHDHEYDGPGDVYNEHVYHDDDHGGWHHHHGDDGSTLYHQHDRIPNHEHFYSAIVDDSAADEYHYVHYGPADHTHDEAA